MPLSEANAGLTARSWVSTCRRAEQQHRQPADRAQHDAQRVGHQAPGDPAADQRAGPGEPGHRHDREDPAPQRPGVLPLFSDDDEPVADRDVLAAAEHHQQHALEGEERGERDDERRDAELRHQDAEDQADHRAGDHGGQHAAYQGKPCWSARWP